MIVDFDLARLSDYVLKVILLKGMAQAAVHRKLSTLETALHEGLQAEQARRDQAQAGQQAAPVVLDLPLVPLCELQQMGANLPRECAALEGAAVIARLENREERAAELTTGAEFLSAVGAALLLHARLLRGPVN